MDGMTDEEMKKKIIEMVNSIEKTRVLKLIYGFILGLM